MNHREPDDFRDEIASHLAHEVDRLMAQGLRALRPRRPRGAGSAT